MSGSAFHRRNQKQKRYERNCKNIHHPAPSERGTKILALPLTLLIMEVRRGDYTAHVIEIGADHVVVDVAVQLDSPWCMLTSFSTPLSTKR